MFRDADCLSRQAQRRYLVYFGIVLTCTVLGGLCAWISAAGSIYRPTFAYLAVLFTILAFILTLAIKERRFEASWYMGRAIAESVKTRTWAFVTCADPYSGSVSSCEIDKRFIVDIGNIWKERGPLILTRKSGAPGSEISHVMREARVLSLRDRISMYVKCRILDQKEWYREKATASSSAENISFTFVIVAQFVAVAIAIHAVSQRLPTSGSVGVLATLISSVLAWLQVKKYQETALAYSIATQELGLAEAIAEGISTDAEFSLFVQETEAAISREHTLWIARRTTS